MMGNIRGKVRETIGETLLLKKIIFQLEKCTTLVYISCNKDSLIIFFLNYFKKNLQLLNIDVFMNIKDVIIIH